MVTGWALLETYGKQIDFTDLSGLAPIAGEILREAGQKAGNKTSGEKPENFVLRIQNRLLGIREGAPERVHFRTECTPIDRD